MFDWVQSNLPEKKLFKVLTFLSALIKFVALLKEILKCPECQNFMKIWAHFSFGPNLSESIILGQEHQFQALYS